MLDTEQSLSDMPSNEMKKYVDKNAIITVTTCSPKASSPVNDENAPPVNFTRVKGTILDLSETNKTPFSVSAAFVAQPKLCSSNKSGDGANLKKTKEPIVGEECRRHLSMMDANLPIPPAEQRAVLPQSNIAEKKCGQVDNFTVDSSLLHSSESDDVVGVPSTLSIPSHPPAEESNPPPSVKDIGADKMIYNDNIVEIANENSPNVDNSAEANSEVVGELRRSLSIIYANVPQPPSPPSHHNLVKAQEGVNMSENSRKRRDSTGLGKKYITVKSSGYGRTEDSDINCGAIEVKSRGRRVSRSLAVRRRSSSANNLQDLCDIGDNSGSINNCGASEIKSKSKKTSGSFPSRRRSSSTSDLKRLQNTCANSNNQGDDDDCSVTSVSSVRSSASLNQRPSTSNQRRKSRTPSRTQMNETSDAKTSKRIISRQRLPMSSGDPKIRSARNNVGNSTTTRSARHPLSQKSRNTLERNAKKELSSSGSGGSEVQPILDGEQNNKRLARREKQGLRHIKNAREGNEEETKAEEKLPLKDTDQNQLTSRNKRESICETKNMSVGTPSRNSENTSQVTGASICSSSTKKRGTPVSGMLSMFRSPKRSRVKTPTRLKTPTRTPSSARSLFDKADNDNAKNNSSPSVFPDLSYQLKDESCKIFGPDTGICDDEIRKVLITKIKGKQWELKKKVESSTIVIKRLKDKLKLLLSEKNRFVELAINAESIALAGYDKASLCVKRFEEERVRVKKFARVLEDNNSSLKESYKDEQREKKQLQDKVVCLEGEISKLKDMVTASESKYTEAALALAVAEGRSEEATKQAESWRAEIASIEGAKADAVRQAEAAIVTTFECEISSLREECSMLKEKMRYKDEELGRLVNLRDGTTLVEGVKKEIDALRNRAIEAESQLALKIAELERTTVDNQAAERRGAAKEKDMSELMKSIGDIQRASQVREDEANDLRKNAEERVGHLEKTAINTLRELQLVLAEKEMFDETSKKLVVSQEKIDLLTAEISELTASEKMKVSELHLEKQLRLRSEEKEREERHERVALSAQMVAMTKEHAVTEAKLKAENEATERLWHDKFDTTKRVLLEKDNMLSDVKETVTGLEGECSGLKNALNEKKSHADAQIVEENGKLQGENNILKERLLDIEKRSSSLGATNSERVRQLEEQVRGGEAERRRMHNIIQELRGNVRVFARIRPFLPGDAVSSDAEPCAAVRDDTELTMSSHGNEIDFSFDRVFSAGVGQEAVFDEVSEFVQSALDGFNVCLFSYGQTCSGKTHTMQGSGTGPMRGIIPRAIEQVGRYKNDLENAGWVYEMKVSFLEIYNENIRDLLREKNPGNIKHEIKQNNDGRRYVSDLTMKVLDPSDGDGVNNIMRQAAKHRSVASTDMNEVSSRSHSVFTMHLTAFHKKQRKTLRGTLNLVDLAGSERLERSGAVGDRAKETVAINKSLSSLADVFGAIGRGASHVPFRNSKLTFLLQPCLSGNGKTLMLVNISPTEESSQESMCSLRFATQVNKCELGKAKRTIEINASDCEDSGDDSVVSLRSARSPRVTGRTKQHASGIVLPHGRMVRRKIA